MFDATGKSRFNLGLTKRERRAIRNKQYLNLQSNIAASKELTQAKLYSHVSERMQATYTGEGMLRGAVAMPHVVTYTGKGAHGVKTIERGLAGDVISSYHRKLRLEQINKVK